MLANIGGALAIIGTIATGVAWEYGQETEIKQVAGAVQQLYDSKEINLYWQYLEWWSTRGLTKEQHSHWCYLAKKHNLPPCASTLRK